MEGIFSGCAGLDGPQRTVVAGVRRLEPDGRVDQHVRTFGTRTDELLALADGRAGQGVVQVALESTGVFGEPVFHLLEARSTMTVVNAQPIQQVPGRKTDVKGCPWIAPSLRHGLLRARFVPPRPIRELRDLTRQRTPLIRQRAPQADRLPKVLEDAPIKRAGVATEILGTAGRARIRALIAGESDPARMAELARRRMRAKIPLLVRASTGRVAAPPRSQPRALREQVGHLEGRIERLDARIQEGIAPFAAEVERLATIAGVKRQAAEGLIAGVGTEMTTSPTAGPLCSWAGMSPGNHPSAGTRSSGRTTPGHPWRRSVLVEAAWAASHTKQARLRLTSPRLARRIGKERAAAAVGRKLLKLVSELWTQRTVDQERSAPDRAAGPEDRRGRR